MSIGMRLRFEILKRDGFTCQYCGQCAPRVALQVDHRTPVALGGGDDPANLVTACRDCNGGKADVPLDACALDGYRPASPRTEPRFAFPPDDCADGPPILLNFNDPFLRRLWESQGTFSKHTALVDLVRRTDTGEPRSFGALADAWGWSKSKVRRFISEAEALGYVEVVR